jgi:hypothetical protein
MAVCAVLVSGCAPKDFKGVAEYKEITAHARAAVQAALKSLDGVSAATSPRPGRVVNVFFSDVKRLEVDSIPLRARAQAILARGDAYFADWDQSITQIRNPRARELAQQHRPQLQASFEKVKLVSKQAGAEFKPFLAGLREMRLDLEDKPTEIDSETGRKLISDTRENGRRMLEKLDAISAELASVTALLTPKSHGSH